MTQRIVVITGSAGGIGTAINQRFRQDQDIVVGLDLADGFDLTQPEQCDQAIQRVIAEHGRHFGRHEVLIILILRVRRHRRRHACLPL